MDSLTEEIERIFMQEQDGNQHCEDEERMKSAFYKGVTCLLNIMMLTIAILGPVFAVIMIGRFLEKTGKLLFHTKKNEDGNP